MCCWEKAIYTAAVDELLLGKNEEKKKRKKNIVEETEKKERKEKKRELVMRGEEVGGHIHVFHHNVLLFMFMLNGLCLFSLVFTRNVTRCQVPGTHRAPCLWNSKLSLKLAELAGTRTEHHEPHVQHIPTVLRR